MSDARVKVPTPYNEPIKNYAAGSPEKGSIKKKLEELKSTEFEIPIIIGGKEIRTGDLADCRCPHDHGHRLATYHRGGQKEVEMAATAAMEARREWSAMPWESRVAIMLRAAELLAGPHRDALNASTMLGQSKTVFQAEIDSACELIDFYRFNSHYMVQIMEEQPESAPGCWNMLEQRPLDGFVFAVTPFNFTSIAGNLPTAPALMGNTVVWKPASSSVYSGYFLMKLWEAAGLPPGVINMVPGPGGAVGTPAMEHPNLAGVHFTGSTEVFQGMWQTVGQNIRNYNCYPRIVGETGGKDFIFVHESAELEPLVAAIVRGAFEYQGQKCSAASRAYIPSNIWDELKDQLVAEIATIKMGDPQDFSNFMGAVIDRAAFKSITEYIEYAKNSSDADIICGGNYDDKTGYFIEPTVIVTIDPGFKTIQEEIFGPVITLYVYDPNDFEATLQICDQTSPYALTGAIFSKDRAAILKASRALSHAAGNFYINDKPTGAVVGQQPFGGSRASGTNDKAGSYLNLIRWTSPRTIKETFVAPRDYRYPFMEES